MEPFQSDSESPEGVCRFTRITEGATLTIKRIKLGNRITSPVTIVDQPLAAA